MNLQRNIKYRSVPVGSSPPKGPTALLHVPAGNVPSNASSHCPSVTNSWTLNRISNMKIYTYNVRGISGDHKLDQLIMELENIDWHIVGISETHRKGEDLLQLGVSNHLFYNRGRVDKRISGVGFLVNNKIAGNVMSFDSISDRIAWIKVRLTKRQTLKIIQVYAPTSSSSEQEIEEFYDDLSKIIEENKTNYTMIIGDFNAKVGVARNSESSVGKHGIGQRNERGDMLVNFAERNGLKITNTFFQKRKGRKWTWKSPNGTAKNEIDYIVTDKIENIKDVTVVNKVDVGSDHRMVACRAKFEFQRERNRMILKKCPREIVNGISEYKEEIQNKFQLLWNPELDLEEKSNNLATIITDAAKTIDHLTKKKKLKKYSKATLELIEKRRSMKVTSREDIIEKAELNKTISKRMRRDKRKKNMKRIRNAIEKGQSVNQAINADNIGKGQMLALKDKNGKIVKNRDELIKITEEYYKNLYASKINVPQVNKSVDNSEIPDITVKEVEFALRHMKRGKAPGKDGITTDLLQFGGETLYEGLAELFNQCIREKRIPKHFSLGIVTLLYKKGDRQDLSNYRPITLLPSMYKLFTKILTNRLTKSLDENQPREQAGFRSGFSTIDHLHSINQLIEKTNEYNIPLCLAFVDYEKAFDSIEHNAVFDSLREQGINENYVQLLENIYSNSTALIKLHKNSNEIKVAKGVRQGDTISPKLFIASLESIFRKIDWDGIGINIDGEYLNNLRFADDINLATEENEHLQNMLTDLSRESNKVGLKMNKGKTKLMFNDKATKKPIKIDDEALEEVKEYIYLGQLITLGKGHEPEIKRRITIGWKAFNKYKDVLKGKLPMCLKRKVYNKCIVPAMTYGCETWRLTKRTENLLRTAQRAMERAMLRITIRDMKSSAWIRRQTRVRDIVKFIKLMKWRWAGHLARRDDNRWSRKLTDWCPLNRKRSRKRPDTRWRDEIQRFAGVTWQRKARCRSSWKEMGKAFVQQWTING